MKTSANGFQPVMTKARTLSAIIAAVCPASSSSLVAGRLGTSRGRAVSHERPRRQKKPARVQSGQSVAAALSGLIGLAAPPGQAPAIAKSSKIAPAQSQKPSRLRTLRKAEASRILLRRQRAKRSTDAMKAGSSIAKRTSSIAHPRTSRGPRYT